MKLFLKTITLAFSIFILTSTGFFISSCNSKLTKDDTTMICKDLLAKQNCCSIAIDCKGLTKHYESHVYEPFLSEKNGKIAVILPVEAKKYNSYTIIDSSKLNDKNVIKILRLNYFKPRSQDTELNNLNTYHALSLEVAESDWETLELIIEGNEETDQEYKKKGRGKIVRDTSKSTEEESTDKKE